MNFLNISRSSWAVLGAILFAAMFALMPEMALAGGLGDVGNKLTTSLTDVKNILMAIIPLIAGILLIWKCFEGFTQHKPVAEIIITCLWIIGAACAFEFALFIFKEGSSIKF